MLVRRFASEILCLPACCFLPSGLVTFPRPLFSDEVLDFVRVVGSVAMSVFMLVVVRGAMLVFLVVVVVVVVEMIDSSSSVYVCGLLIENSSDTKRCRWWTWYTNK